jgi:hypothetical protein
MTALKCVFRCLQALLESGTVVMGLMVLVFIPTQTGLATPQISDLYPVISLDLLRLLFHGVHASTSLCAVHRGGRIHGACKHDKRSNLASPISLRAQPTLIGVNNQSAMKFADNSLPCPLKTYRHLSPFCMRAIDLQ